MSEQTAVQKVEEKTVQGKPTVFYVAREALETLYTITEALDEIHLTVTPRSLVLRQMDPAHIAMVDAVIKTKVKGLQKPIHISIDRERLKDVFKVLDAFGEFTKPERFVEFKITPEYKVKKHSNGRKEKTLVGNSLTVADHSQGFAVDEQPKEYPKPNTSRLKGMSRFEVNTAEFLKAVKAVAKIAEVIGIEYSKRRWRVGIQSYTCSSWRELPRSQKIFRGSPKPFRSLYMAEMLQKLIFPSISKYAEAKAKENMPICLIHRGKGITVTTWLAPRLQ